MFAPAVLVHERANLIRAPTQRVPASGRSVLTVSPQRPYDVAVIGGGAIGLSVAWRAAQRGLRTVVLERGTPGGGTSRVAAGMLAPVAEATFGEQRLVDMKLRAAAAWPAFAAELAEAAGRDPGYRPTGTLYVARDRDAAEALTREADFRRSLGLELSELRPSRPGPRAGAGPLAARGASPAHRPRSRSRCALRRPGACGGPRRCRGTGELRGRRGPGRRRPGARRAPTARRARGGGPGRGRGRRVVVAAGRDPRARPSSGSPRQGPGPSPPRPGRPGPAERRPADRGRLHRAPRRRPLCAGGERRGEGLRRLSLRRRHLRAAARRLRGPPGGSGARARGGAGRPAPGNARQPAARRSVRAAARPGVGDRPLPQRDPARPGTAAAVAAALAGERVEATA